MRHLTFSSTSRRVSATALRPRLLRQRHLRPTLLLSVIFLPALLLSGCGREEEPLDPERFPLLPLPADVDPEEGEFQVTEGTRIVLSHPPDAELAGMVDRWAEPIREASGFPLPVMGAGEGSGRGVIEIELKALKRGRAATPGEGGPVPAGMGLPGTEAEGYELEVKPRRVKLEAEGKAGIYYGLGTLGQLLPGLHGSLTGSRGARPEAGPGEVASGDRAADASSTRDPWSIPAVEIEDEPRFRYRGMHLDVGRHFFPVSFLKRYIDLLAAYKMNVFHWHLTEDQGWRLEIPGYPRLAEVASCRAETILEKNFNPYVGDGTRYCGYYTQGEALEIVEYARERFITVIPEIEMPGHSVAALAAYPELACTEGPFEVATRWGVFRDIYCPRGETFAFLEDVLSEVMEIFPSPYIHIGGDEAPKAAWEASEFAQEVIAREGLADEEELQSWFIGRIEAFLNENGRRLIGWDEILEGGLAPDATVMSWRGMEGGIEAAREEHDVVMTPTSHLYFDYYQGDTLQEPLAIGGFAPLEKVYEFEPVPPELNPTQARHVLGAQGNVWTEYMKTTEYVEYMVLPRMLALSEVVWSPASQRSWKGFTSRLPIHLGRLESQGINFRIPEVSGLEVDRLALGDSTHIELSTPVGGGEVRYTLDGSDPDSRSPRYGGPFQLAVDENGTEVSARVFLQDGRMGHIGRARFTRTQLIPPVSVPLSGRGRGLAFSDAASQPNSGPRLSGFIRVPRKGIYTFFLSSADGRRLTVSDRVVVDHDGPRRRSGGAGQVALHRGWHPIEVLYSRGRGARGLRLEIEGPDTPRRGVPVTWLAHLR